MDLKAFVFTAYGLHTLVLAKDPDEAWDSLLSQLDLLAVSDEAAEANYNIWSKLYDRRENLPRYATVKTVVYSTEPALNMPTIEVF